jgi:hypothetical protein
MLASGLKIGTWDMGQLAVMVVVVDSTCSLLATLMLATSTARLIKHAMVLHVKSQQIVEEWRSE